MSVGHDTFELEVGLRSAQLVIPCYNERLRLDAAKVAALVDEPSLGVVLVDDGSRDDTLPLLREIAAHPSGAISVLALPENVGKGEAVRAGVLHAMHNGATYVGYADADFSTEPDELIRLLHVLQRGAHSGVIGSRFARLGARIERKRSRHYMGRVFATFAAIALDLMVYDTQCGAKWFLVNDSLRRSLKDRFHTRWAFDVELIGRMIGRFGPEGDITSPEMLIEEPLNAWRDVGGSKLSPTAMAKAFLDLLRLLMEAQLPKGK